MKKFAVLGLSCAFFAGGLLGLLGLQAVPGVSAEEETTTVEFSETKIKRSQDMEYLLIATAIQNYDDVYEVGYDFGESYTIQETDNIYKDRYFTSIVTSGGEKETAKDIFGAEYEGWGMIVWEVEYDPTAEISYTAYALVGVRNDQGNLMKPTDPENVIKELGTPRTTPVLERTVTFVDGENEDTRTVVYGQGLAASAIPAFTGTPNEGKEFYWALSDGTEADFSEIKQDVTVTKTERTIVNTVEFAFDIAANYYNDGYEYSTADQMNALSKEVECNYGEDIAFGVLVDMNYNRSIDDVKYVFHNAETGATTELTATTQDGFVVYTLDGAKAADGYVEMVGAYAENTYEVALNLNLYDWGVLKTFDGVTVTAGGENVAVEDGKAVAMLAKGTHELVVAEPNGKETTVSVELNPTSWDECLNLSAEETVAVGYSRYAATDSNKNNKTGNYKQDANGTIVPNSAAENVNNTISLTDYVIDGSTNYAVKARFICTASSDSPDFRITLTNGTNTFMLGVNKMYFRMFVNSTELKPDHSLDSKFSAGLTNAATTPFVVDLMILKTESKLSIYHTIGSTDGSYIHYGDVTAEGVKLANGEFAHTVLTSNDVMFSDAVATNFNAFLGAADLKMSLMTTGSTTFTKYSEYGVKTEGYTSAYKVEYYQQKADKSGYELASEETLTGLTNSAVTAQEKAYAGFVLDSANESAVASGVVAEDGSLVLKLYYNRASVGYTTEYYYENANDDGFTIAEGETVSASGVHGEEISVTPADKTGFELDNTQSVLTITLDAEGNNVLKVYYKRVRVTVTFVDGANEVTRTAKYGYGLIEAAPEFTGTPTAGYDFYWALSDGTTVDSYAGLTEDIIVSKIEKDNSSVNTVSFALENSAVVEYYNENGEALESMQNLASGTDVVFKVKVDMNYNRSADVRYVFTPNGGEAVDFEKTVDGEYFVYTLAAANAADGVVTMIGEYVENTYEATVSLNLYGWGVLETLDGVTVKIGDESVAVVDGKATASLPKGTYSVVITEPTTRTTTISLAVNPTDWVEALTYSANKTITVGYSRNTATASNGTTDWSKYFPQDENGAIVANSGTPGNTTNGANIKFTDHVIDGSKDYAVKARFTYNGDNYSSDLSPFYRLYLRNASGNNFAVIVNKLYVLIQINGGTEYKIAHNQTSTFNTALANAGTTPFNIDVMIVKTEGKLSVYHTVGSADGSYTHFVDVTSAGIKLPNGEFAHTYNTTTDITFDATVATNVNNFLAAKDLNVWLRTSNAAVATVYSEYGVTTDSKKWEALIA